MRIVLERNSILYPAEVSINLFTASLDIQTVLAMEKMVLKSLTRAGMLRHYSSVNALSMPMYVHVAPWLVSRTR